MSGERAHDARAFEESALEHLSSLYSFARRLAANAKDAEDLVQETYLRALRNPQAFTPGTNMRAWLFRILRNVHVSEHRKRSVRPEPLDVPEQEGEYERQLEALEGGGDPEAALREALLGTRIEEALEELPEDFRMVILLCLVQGFTYAEAAEILEVPVGTVMSRLHRARRLLQLRLLRDARERGLGGARRTEDVRDDSPHPEDET